MKDPYSKEEKYRILIIGANGMIGHMIFDYFCAQKDFETFGLVRKICDNKINQENLIQENNLSDQNKIRKLIENLLPNLVINCIGIVKQNLIINDIDKSIYLNSFFPKVLHQICQNNQIRFLTFSTDCVFKGTKGFYNELDVVDSEEIYGISKYLGEIGGYNNALTLRTSFIGKELNKKRGLLEWFLLQSKLKKNINGYANAIYSGLPTIEIARIIHKYIIPNADLHGLYHLSSEPINKYTLLKLIKENYSLDIMINKDYDNVIDRSLDSSKFKSETGFNPQSWEKLIQTMYMNNL